MPSPAVLIITVLMGWPLVQIISVLFVRRPRAELRRLAAELKGDPRYGASDHALVDREIREARGEPAFVIAPLMLPLALLAAAVWELVGRDHPSAGGGRNAADFRRDVDQLEARLGLRAGDETVVLDPRFRRLAGLALDIGFLRWPVTAALTVLTCLPVLPFCLMAYGIRQTIRAVPTAAASLAKAFQLATLGLQASAIRSGTTRT